MIEKIKNDMIEAVKSGDNIKRNILKLVISEVQSYEARKNHPIINTEIEKILNLFIKNNKEVIGLSTDEGKVQDLCAENVILEKYLPKKISKEEIDTYITGNIELFNSVIKTTNMGQAVGLVMKSLKKDDLRVDSNDVKEIVGLICN